MRNEITVRGFTFVKDDKEGKCLCKKCFFRGKNYCEAVELHERVCILMEDSGIYGYWREADKPIMCCDKLSNLIRMSKNIIFDPSKKTWKIDFGKGSIEFCDCLFCGGRLS